MYFLCPQHRQELIQLPEIEISSRWFDWMCQASEFYELKDWQKATPFAGCAMDLTSCALLRHDIKGKSLATHATLAAIYAINLLQHQHEIKHATISAEQVAQRIQSAIGDTEKTWAETCIKALSEPAEQIRFFKDYLNFPFELVDHTGANIHPLQSVLH